MKSLQIDVSTLVLALYALLMAYVISSSLEEKSRIICRAEQQGTSLLSIPTRTSTPPSTPTPAIENDSVVLASWYDFQGRKKKNGRPFRNKIGELASRNYPIGTQLKLTCVSNCSKIGKTVRGTVTDFGPQDIFDPKRDLDVSKATARELGFTKQGLAFLRVEIVKRAS